jgi:hypothetical protein
LKDPAGRRRRNGWAADSRPLVKVCIHEVTDLARGFIQVLGHVADARPSHRQPMEISKGSFEFARISNDFATFAASK